MTVTKSTDGKLVRSFFHSRWSRNRCGVSQDLTATGTISAAKETVVGDLKTGMTSISAKKDGHNHVSSLCWDGHTLTLNSSKPNLNSKFTKSAYKRQKYLEDKPDVLS